MKTVFMIIIGSCYGLLSSSGVFTVLVAVGLVPRFAGRTHTADKILLYEEAIVYGAIAGCFVSVFPEYAQFAAWWLKQFPNAQTVVMTGGWILQGIVGVSSGMFVGCLALAIAEMLESIPIFTRRIAFRHGIELMILSVAIGKVVGSFLYFITEFYKTVGD